MASKRTPLNADPFAIVEPNPEPPKPPVVLTAVPEPEPKAEVLAEEVSLPPDEQAILPAAPVLLTEEVEPTPDPERRPSAPRAAKMARSRPKSVETPAPDFQLEKGTFWIRPDQQADLLEEKLRLLRQGVKMGVSDIVRDAIDHYMVCKKK